MARFELLPGGDHSGPGTKKDVANHKPGAKITSEHPLDELFVNRFRRLPDEEEEKPKAKAAVTEPDEEEEEEGEDTTSPLGNNVTASIEGTKEAGLLVFQLKNGHFNVSETLAPDDAINDEPLTQKDLKKLLKKHQKKED